METGPNSSSASTAPCWLLVGQEQRGGEMEREASLHLVPLWSGEVLGVLPNSAPAMPDLQSCDKTSSC